MAQVPMESDPVGKPSAPANDGPLDLSKLPGNGYLSDKRLKADPDHKIIDEHSPKAEKVVTAPVIRKKKGLGTKFKEAFFGEDAKSIGEYLLWDVGVPALKNFILDGVTQGLTRALYGESASARRGTSTSTYTSYNRFYNSGRNDVSTNRTMSVRARSMHDFDDIVIATRQEAENVLDTMMELLDQYSAVTVRDFYDLVGVTGSYTDDKWGWKDLRASGINRVRNGYILDLPKPEVLS